MNQVEGILKNDILSLRMKNAIIKKDEFELDFSDFEKLLDFDDTSSGGIIVSLQIMPSKKIDNIETMILEKTNCLRNKTGLITEIKKVKEVKEEKTVDDMDFSMFDSLLNDFTDVPKQAVSKKTTKKEKISLLKDEIKYYQSKIDEKYSLDNLEKYESKLFEIKNKLDDLRGFCSFSFLDYKFSATDIKEIISSLNACSSELEDIISDKNVKLSRKQTIDKISEKVINNIEKQKEFLLNIKKEIVDLNNNVASKIYFCMVKRMMFNLYRLIVGMYKLENSKKNHLKLNTGIFLIINALIGMKKALTLDFSDDGYFYYKDYVNNNMTTKEITTVTFTLINKSSLMITEIQKIMKKDFAKYKNYLDDYEEVYFKLSKFKELIDNQSKECENLMEVLDVQNKKNILK